MSSRFKLFLVVAPGFESVAADEVRAHIGAEGRAVAGGVELVVDGAGLAACVTQLSVPEAVRVRVARFDARTFDALEAGVSKVPWHVYTRGVPEVRATCRKSALYHSDAVAERVTAAIAARARSTDSQGRVHVRLDRDKATLSVEATGTPAAERGFGHVAGRGSLRPTLAAAALRAAGLLDADALWDPFCGSGTFGVEWLRARLGAPVFGDRAFAFTDWKVPADAPAPAGPMGAARLWLSDRASAAIETARANVERRGWSEHVSFHEGDVAATAAHPPAGAAVICNLPYGKRVKGAEPAIRMFGDALRARPDLGPVVAVDGARAIERWTGLPWEEVCAFDNRGTKVRLMRLAR